MKELFIALFVLWLSVFGFAMILGQHQRFARWTGQALRWVWRRLAALWRWGWRNFRQGIIGFVIGILTALYAVGYFR
jgi:hypothetical protein